MDSNLFMHKMHVKTTPGTHGGAAAGFSCTLRYPWRRERLSLKLTTGFADPRGHETGPTWKSCVLQQSRVPHISLVFREMWGTLDL
jgi:hypothetical protein